MECIYLLHGCTHALLRQNYTFLGEFQKVKDQIQKVHVHFALTLFEFGLKLFEIAPKKV